MITWLRYVAMSRIGEYLALGWHLVDDMADCHHGRYSVIMEWRGSEPPPNAKQGD